MQPSLTSLRSLYPCYRAPAIRGVIINRTVLLTRSVSSLRLTTVSFHGISRMRDFFPIGSDCVFVVVVKINTTDRRRYYFHRPRERFRSRSPRRRDSILRNFIYCRRGKICPGTRRSAWNVTSRTAAREEYTEIGCGRAKRCAVSAARGPHRARINTGPRAALSLSFSGWQVAFTVIPWSDVDSLAFRIH